MSEKAKTIIKNKLDKKSSLNVFSNSKAEYSILFPEWLEQDILSEKFESGLLLDKKLKEKSDGENAEGFEDNQVMFLPYSIVDLYDWKRPKDVFPEANIVMFSNDPPYDYPDLITHSKHLLHSEFMRSFISSIILLQYIGNTSPFQTEGVNNKFSRDDTDIAWKPWFHIYSSAKQNEMFAPQINNAGKYIVRLYWMGSWRKIYVDDFLPIDKWKHVLLPSLIHTKDILNATEKNRLAPKISISNVGSSLEPPKVKANTKTDRKQAPNIELQPDRPTVELWPYILCKALLKLANITMQKEDELLDFDIIHTLTGWVLQTLDVKNLHVNNIWNICQSHAQNFKWDEYYKSEVNLETLRSRNEKKQNFSQNKVENKTEEAESHSRLLFVESSDTRSFQSKTIQNYSPCWGHIIFIQQTRDIPLERPEENEVYPLWKQFRWMDWAVQKGIAKPVIPLDKTKYLKCVSPFRLKQDHVVYKHFDKNELKTVEEKPKRSLTAIAHEKQYEPAVVEKALKATSDIKSDKRRISKEKNVSQKVPSIVQYTIEDISVWLKFEEFVKCMNKFKLFFKPSTFKYKTRVNDVERGEMLESTAMKLKSATSTEWHHIKWPAKLQSQNNHPLNLFIDSLDSKFIVLNLSQTGNVGRVMPYVEKLDENNFFTEYAKLFQNKTSYSDVFAPRSLPLNRNLIHQPLKRSHLIIEKFRWNDLSVGEFSTFLYTYGSKSIIIELPPGRHMFSLWIKSEFPYTLTILSDTLYELGSLEMMVDSMIEEPVQLTQLSLNICKAFRQLIDNFGTTDFQEYLHNYYKSYWDNGVKLSKKELVLVHRVFQDHFVEALSNIHDLELDSAVEALRALFVDPSIGLRKKYDSNRSLPPFTFRSPHERAYFEKASKTLTSFFKRVTVQSLRKKHDSKNIKFSATIDMLRELYNHLFMTSRRHFLSIVIRNYLTDPRLDGITNRFEFYKEMDWDIDAQILKGTLNESVGGWNPIFRYIFTCQETITVRMLVFSNINNYILCVINNDTHEEMFRYTKKVLETKYEPNINGYTIFFYGWLKEVKTVQWKLYILTPRNSTQLYDVTECKVIIQRMMENYVPNYENLICKYLLQVKEEAYLSFRFSCSYDVKFLLRIKNSSGDNIINVTGRKAIVVPMVALNVAKHSKSDTELSMDLGEPEESLHEVHQKKSIGGRGGDKEKKKKSVLFPLKTTSLVMQSSAAPQQTYLLECFVLDNSWPLNRREWQVVESIKQKNLARNLDVSSSTTRRLAKSGKKIHSKKEKDVLSKVEEPFYSLETVVQNIFAVNIVRDKNVENSMMEMKKIWYDSEPGRYDRSQLLRSSYLEKHYDWGCQCPLNIGQENSSRFSQRTEEDIEVDETRYLEMPKNDYVNIPPLDLTPHFKNDVQTVKKCLKRPIDYQREQEELDEKLMDFEDKFLESTYDMTLYLDELGQRRILMAYWYSDVRKLSEKIMAAYNVKRENYLKNTLGQTFPNIKKDIKVGKKVSDLT